MDILNFINSIKKWTSEQDTIHALILLGSLDVLENTSTIKLQMITTTPKVFIDNPVFVNNFGVVVESNISTKGIVTCLHIWYSHGIEVEFFITTPIWISVPLEEETVKVLRGGYEVLIDNKNYFKNPGMNLSNYKCEE